MKAATRKEIPSRAAGVSENAPPRSLTNVEELKAKLNLFIVPDYSHGDYWPKLDRRLCGLLPDLIAQALDALEVRYPSQSANARQDS